MTSPSAAQSQKKHVTKMLMPKKKLSGMFYICYELYKGVTIISHSWLCLVKLWDMFSFYFGRLVLCGMNLRMKVMFLYVSGGKFLLYKLNHVSK